MNVPAADAVPLLAAGVLTAEGRFTDDLTVPDAVEVLSALRGRSIWLPGPFADEADADARLALPPQRLASWSPPDRFRTERLEQALVDAWQQADLGAGGNLWAQPALRLVVPGLDDQRALTGADARGLLVATHMEMTAGRFAWRWPLRISVPRVDGLEEIAGGHFFGRLYAIKETAPGDEVDLVVVRPDDIGRLDDVLATVAVVVGADGWDPSELLESATRRGLAAVLLVPDITPGLLDLLIEEMSHDQPLDVATAIHLRGAALAASGDFLAFTSVRAWTDYVGAQLPAPEGEELRHTARHRPFDHESDGTSHAAEVAARADPQLLAAITSVRLAQAAIGEAGIEPEPQAPPPQPPTAAPRPVTPPAAEPPPSAAKPGERRLQAKLTDGKGRVRTDGFVAGQRHELRIRIAAEQSADVLPANVRFDPPVPGQPVDLTIVVRVRGSKDPPARRKLSLPADADSAWTNPVPIDVPRRATSVAVEIVVLHDGRALQTATLGTRVVRRRKAGVGPFALLVDADTPPSGFEDRATSAVTLLLSAPLGEAPELLDLSTIPQPLSLAGLDKANKAVRKILLDSFLDPPADLAGAAPPLTKLAVRGATLRNQLRGNEDSFYDDEPWIHVVCFGQTDLPLELIYTHPMPDSDDSVPVCPTAVAGATECVADCPDRNRSDCVCPFGFWGTSKVVERRVHIEGRTGTTPPQQRRIPVTAGAVVGTSTKADEEDKDASKRIVAAVKGSVAASGFAHIVSWDELATAVAAVERQVLVLITHTVKPADPELDLGISFELGGTLKAAHRVDQTFVNPNSREPGPVVVSLGCDTDDLDVGYADWVGTLHAARAEIVISTISPVPGREVANFVERMFRALPQQLAAAGPHRCGAMLTAVRRATIATGDVLALAITASGDGDVELTAESIEGG